MAAKSVLDDSSVLGVFQFAQGAADDDARLFSIPLEFLEGTGRVDVLHSALPVEHGTQDGFGYAFNTKVLLAKLRVEMPAAGAEAQAYEAYRRIHDFINAQGYPHPLRLWNYIDDINRGEGDDEIYKLFCVGRARALQELENGEEVLPAATAIGSHDNDGALVIHLLAAHSPGIQIENPRQVSAFQYPRQYGIRSPLFSRARVMHWPGNSHLYLSGTASVVGHETLHAGDCRAQLQECLRNVDTILKTTATDQDAGFTHEHLRLLRVYLRNRGDLDTVKACLDARLPKETPVEYLLGDICRQDLLVELEGLYIRPA